MKRIKSMVELTSLLAATMLSCHGAQEPELSNEPETLTPSSKSCFDVPACSESIGVISDYTEQQRAAIDLLGIDNLLENPGPVYSAFVRWAEIN